jgi:Uma2 family endonuclease
MSIELEVPLSFTPPAIPFGTRMTLEEWADLDEEVEGELVDGVLVEEEMATHIHEALVGILIGLLRAWARPRVALIGGSDSKFGVASRRGRKPDVYAYLPGSRFPRAHESMSRRPPDIMVEIVSRAARDVRRDRVEKMRDYAAFGAKTYWVVDPQNRIFEILSLGADGKYVIAVTAVAGTIEDVPLCEGLTIDLDAMWAEVDAIIAAGAGEDDASDD